MSHYTSPVSGADFTLVKCGDESLVERRYEIHMYHKNISDYIQRSPRYTLNELEDKLNLLISLSTTQLIQFYSPIKPVTEKSNSKGVKINVT